MFLHCISIEILGVGGVGTINEIEFIAIAQMLSIISVELKSGLFWKFHKIKRNLCIILYGFFIYFIFTLFLCQKFFPWELLI